MELWLDTIDLDFIRAAVQTCPIAGITTNPTILGKTDVLPEKKLEQLLAIQPGYVAAQVLAHDTSDIIDQAIRLADLSDRIIVKVPVTPAGLAAITVLTQKNIRTLATAIFDPAQLYLAVLAGAAYAAPYLARMEVATRHSLSTLNDMMQIIKQQNYKIKLMAAAIHTMDQVLFSLQIGVPAITVPLAIYEQLTGTHPKTAESLKEFDVNWQAGTCTSDSVLFN